MRNSIVQTIINIVFILSIVIFAYLHIKDEYKIGFIKTNYVLSKYEYMIDATNLYKEKSDGWQANIDTLSREFQESVIAYNKEKDKMSEREIKITEELLKTKQKQLMDYEQGIKGRAQ